MDINAFVCQKVERVQSFASRGFVDLPPRALSAQQRGCIAAGTLAGKGLFGASPESPAKAPRLPRRAGSGDRAPVRRRLGPRARRPRPCWGTAAMAEPGSPLTGHQQGGRHRGPGRAGRCRTGCPQCSAFKCRWNSSTSINISGFPLCFSPLSPVPPVSATVPVGPGSQPHCQHWVCPGATAGPSLADRCWGCQEQDLTLPGRVGNHFSAMTLSPVPGS